MRVKNDALIAEARTRIESETAAARGSLQQEAESLAEQIATTVLTGRAS